MTSATLAPPIERPIKRATALGGLEEKAPIDPKRGVGRADEKLGIRDLNPEYWNQNPACYQLHQSPRESLPTA